jgi:hypothetical protein
MSLFKRKSGLEPTSFLWESWGSLFFILCPCSVRFDSVNLYANYRACNLFDSSIAAKSTRRTKFMLTPALCCSLYSILLCLAQNNTPLFTLSPAKRRKEAQTVDLSNNPSRFNSIHLTPFIRPGTLCTMVPKVRLYSTIVFLCPVRLCSELVGCSRTYAPPSFPIKRQACSA